MSIRPVDFNGMLQRTDDVGVLKHQQEHKPLVDQQNIQVQLSKQEENASQQVVTANQSEKLNNHTDAREEGKGQYHALYRGKKKKTSKEDGKVVKKGSSHSFDIKI